MHMGRIWPRRRSLGARFSCRRSGIDKLRDGRHEGRFKSIYYNGASLSSSTGRNCRRPKLPKAITFGVMATTIIGQRAGGRALGSLGMGWQGCSPMVNVEAVGVLLHSTDASASALFACAWRCVSAFAVSTKHKIQPPPKKKIVPHMPSPRRGPPELSHAP